jgi:hypothetical protein
MAVPGEKIWFGTREYMQWIKAPAVNVDASKNGWFSPTNYLDGGAYVRRSWSSHKEYSLSWNLASRATLRPILDYADGIYGTGEVYWVDPFAADVNVLPQYWASPVLGTLDGPVLTGLDTRPTKVATTANMLGYPTSSAFYTVPLTGTKPSVWLPIPPGYTLWLGVHGSNGTGGAVVATPTTGATSTGTPTTLTMLSVTTMTRFNSSFDGNTYNGVLLSLGGSGTVTLSGMIAQVLPTGMTPADGGFLSGQGHSGCQFGAQPTLTEYNAVMDKVGVSAKLIEVSAWL